MAGTNGTVGTIFLNLQVNQNLGQQITSASNSTASAISGSVGSMFKKFIGVAAVATAVNALKEIGSAAIETASDLAEAQNVVDVAFGEMAQDCEEFAKIAIEQFGISELAAKKTASTFMSMGKSMGIASQDASQMAINTTKLSADVASFYNISQSEAATKLKGIYTGETEALKELGVVMTQTNLKQYALDKGIKTSYDDMDQAQKVSLRYKYVMEQLSLAQGDFSRTQSSWSNQTKILKENWTQFLSTIGQGLIKVLQPALQLLNDMVEVLNEFANTLSNKFGWKEVEEETEQSTKTMGDTLASNISDGVAEAKKELLGLASFDEINSLGGSTDETSDSEAFDIFGDEYTTQQEANTRENIFKKMISNIKKEILNFWNEIKDPVMQVVTPLFELLKDGFKVVKEEFGLFSEFVTNLWNDRLKPLIEDLKTLYLNLFNNILLPVTQNLFKTISQWWDDSGREFFMTLVQAIYSIYSAVVNVANFFAEYFGPILSDFINLCVNTLFDALGKIGDFFTLILKFIIYCADQIASSFKNIKQTLIDGFNAIKELFSVIFYELWNVIKTPINWIIEALNVLIDAMNTLSWDVPDWVPGIGGSTFGFNIPNIPMLAEGGIVTQPTLAMIGEGSQNEAVLPLDNLRVMIAEVVAEVMAEYQTYSEDNNQDLHLTLNLDGSPLYDNIIKGINRRTRNQGKEVILSI